jgi:hypothetical protein
VSPAQNGRSDRASLAYGCRWLRKPFGFGLSLGWNPVRDDLTRNPRRPAEAGLLPRQICLIRAGVSYAIRARTRAHLERTQIVRPRPSRTCGGEAENARGTGVMRLVTVRQDAPEWVSLAGRGSSDRSHQAWRRHLFPAGVVIECPGVEHRAGSIDRWLDSPPQEVGDCAPVLSIRGWDVVYSLAVKASRIRRGIRPRSLTV